VSAPVRLDDLSVAAIAERVVELLREEGVGPDPIDAAEVARRLGVSRDYVYEHAEELGAIRLGEGSRGRLRFDPVTVHKNLTEKRDEVRDARRDIRKPVRRSQVPLLPVKGEET